MNEPYNEMQPQFNFGRNAEREVDQHQILTLHWTKHTFGTL